jgi:PAS domain S-box-containing protein
MKFAGGIFQRRWLNLSLRLKGLVVTTLPVIALLAFSASFWVVEQQYKNAGKWIGSSLQVYATMQKVRTALLEESGAVRSYALTNDPQHLKAYNDSLKEGNTAMRQLEAAATNSQERAHVTALRGLVAQHQSAMAEYVAGIQPSAGPGNAAAGAWLEKNHQAMSKIDVEVAALQQVERRTLVADSVALGRALWISNVAVLASIVLGLIGGILAMLLFASGIVSRVKRAQESAAGLAEGRMPPPHQPANDEIGRLSDALRRTATLLQQRTAEAERRTRELAESEAANQKQARLLQCILDSMGDAVMVADQTGRMVLCNPAARTLFGEESLDLVPERWTEHTTIYLSDSKTPVPLDDLPLVRAIRGENPGATQLLLRRDTGESIWIDVTARALRGDSDAVRGGVAVIRDVTATKHTEETLRLAREAAEEANQAKSEFLSRMSHELRTPLNAILGFAQLLDLDHLSAPQRQSVDQILKGGRHLLTLINEVLDLARIEAGKLSLSTEPIESGETIRSSIELVGPLAQQSDVNIRLQDNPEWRRHVLADRQRLQQVILNLLSNAIKYNRRGGTVTVSCRVVADRFHLAVRDTGDGLSPEKLGRLFRPFERLDNDRYGVEGTGIGLALSKRLVDAMGGAIGVESEVGIGSTFWVELPICAGLLDDFDRFHGDGIKELSAPAAGKTTKLLYIEDNLSNNLLMERILENRPDVQLISAMQGRLGIDLARQHRPDLICLDLHLPDITGLEVLKALRSQPVTADTPIAMISADATPGQIDRLMEAGANAYFTKPLDVKAILRYVDEVLGVGVHV